jgi:hypothetical protein
MPPMFSVASYKVHQTLLRWWVAADDSVRNSAYLQVRQDVRRIGGW